MHDVLGFKGRVIKQGSIIKPCCRVVFKYYHDFCPQVLVALGYKIE